MLPQSSHILQRAESTPCTTCQLTRREDGSIVVIDRAIHETIGRAVLYDETVAKLSKRDNSFVIPLEEG